MNTAWAIALVDALASQGVRHAVLCPGSRNTPLVLALEDHPDVATHVHIDERGAAYFAVGIGRATRRPAVVVTTSGTAVANLLPACIEAHQDNVPLLLLTADRPQELRNSGANQTMDQVGLFSRFVRAEADLPHVGADVEAWVPHVDAMVGQATAWPPGPVHMNQPLRKPLEPTQEDQARLADLRRQAPRPPPTPPVRPQGKVPDLRLEGRGVVVCGPGSLAGLGPACDGVPVLADALSGLRFGPHPTCDAVDLYLGHPGVQAALKPDWVLQFGRSPTSTPLRSFLASHPDVPRFLVDASGRGWSDIPGNVEVLDCDPASLLRDVRLARDAEWHAKWVSIDDRAKKSASEALAATPDAEANWVPAVVGSSQRLFVGNSLPVRDLERFGRSEHPIEVHANRGVSGIDGTIATAAGVAVAAGPTTAVIGDVAFQHDVGSLAHVPKGLRLVVIDNGGGRLFHHLPVSHATPHFERLFLTPPQIDIEKACAAFGLDAVRVRPSGLAQALDGDAVVVVESDGAASARWRQRVEAQAQQQVLALLK